MSSDNSIQLPRKKPSVLWWIAGFFLLLLLLFIVQLFGPNPPIIVSPQTTYITEPLGPEGLPDYEQHILELSREGVTPENNAAVLLWEALFPGEVDPSQYTPVSRALGLDYIPAAENAIQRLSSDANRRRIAAFLAKRGGSEGIDVLADSYDPHAQTIEQILDRVLKQPWTSEQLPPVATWVTKNQAPLDLLVVASRRPRYFAPSPTYIDSKPDLLIEMLLPHAQSMRDAGRSLATRAMWHVGESRPSEAWADLLAIYRLAHLLTQGQTLVEQLVAMAMSSMACDGTVALLHHESLNANQARHIQQDLLALPNFNGMARSLDTMERLAALDAFMHVGRGGGGDAFAALTGAAADDFGNNAFDVISVDWNFVLRETNRWYDRLAAAARLPDRAARQTAMDQIEADIQQLAADTRQPGNWAVAALSRRERSQIVSGIMLALFLPAVTAATNAEDRANANLELIRTAAALAIHRIENGSYPETLQALLPAPVDMLPIDPYNGKPFRYKRMADGYLLYSVGENGRDDGGSNERDRVLNGQPLDDLEQGQADSMSAQIPAGADDISISVPRWAFELPKMAAPSE